jgi:hypothetical protein
VDSNLNLNSNLNQENSLKEKGKRHYPKPAANQPFGPQPLSAHLPAQLTTAAAPPTACRRSVTDQRAPRPASARPRDDASASSPTFSLWLTPKGKGGGGSAGREARRRGVPRAPAHPGRPCVPGCSALYKSRRRAQEGAPNPSRTGGAAPDRTHRPPEEKG